MSDKLSANILSLSNAKLTAANVCNECLVGYLWTDSAEYPDFFTDGAVP